MFQFEGVPTYPHTGRFWEIIEKYKVSKFYTAPTAIRALMKFGDEPVKKWVDNTEHNYLKKRLIKHSTAVKSVYLEMRFLRGAWWNDKMGM